MNKKFIVLIACSIFLILPLPTLVAMGVSYGNTDVGQPSMVINSSNWKSSSEGVSEETLDSDSSSLSQENSSGKSSSSQVSVVSFVSNENTELDNQRQSNGQRDLVDSIFLVGGVILVCIPLIILMAYVLARTNKSIFQKLFQFITFKKCNAYEIKPLVLCLRIIPLTAVGTLCITGTLKQIIISLWAIVCRFYK